MADSIERAWRYHRAINHPGIDLAAERGEPSDFPPFLHYAKQVNIDNLRPWEYDAMSAWDYDRIRGALDAYEAAKRKYPVVQRKADAPQYTQPITPGEGPQFVPDEDEL